MSRSWSGIQLVDSAREAPVKSHLFQQISPNAHLIQGKATVAKMFVNNANGSAV